MKNLDIARVKAVAQRLGFELSEQSDGTQELDARVYALAEFFYMDGAKSVAIQAVEEYREYQDRLVRECRDIANSAYYTHSQMLAKQKGGQD